MLCSTYIESISFSTWNSDDSGENITIACRRSVTKATAMQVGCHEKRLDPGTASQKMKPVKATDSRWTTILGT